VAKSDETQTRGRENTTMNTIFDVVRSTILTSTGRGFLTKLMGNTYKWLNSLYKIIIRRPEPHSLLLLLFLFFLPLSSPWFAVPLLLLSFLSSFIHFLPFTLHGPVWASSNGPVWAWSCIGLRILFFGTTVERVERLTEDN
jgi:hypothetical protein